MISNKVKQNKRGFVQCIIVNTPLMCYCFSYFSADLRLTSLQADTSKHCETMDTS